MALWHPGGQCRGRGVRRADMAAGAQRHRERTPRTVECSRRSPSRVYYDWTGGGARVARFYRNVQPQKAKAA